MKPDFSKMTKTELKTYIRSHHEDDEAIRELFGRPTDNALFFPMPKTKEEAEEIENVIREKIQQKTEPNSQ